MVTTLEGDTRDVLAVAFSPDGARILICSRDNTVRLWDAVTGKMVTTLDGDTGDVTGMPRPMAPAS